MKRFAIILFCLVFTAVSAGAEKIEIHDYNQTRKLDIRNGTLEYDNRKPDSIDGFYYFLNEDGTATVFGMEKLPSKLVIPATLGPYQVTAVGPKGFSTGTGVKTLVISEGIVSIGAHAFTDYFKLTSLTLPSTLKEIGDYAFEGANSLKKIKLPEHLETLGERAFAGLNSYPGPLEIPDSLINWGRSAFAGCHVLKAFKVSDAHPTLAAADGVLYSKDMTRAIAYPGGRKNGTYEMPESVTEMDNYFAWYASTLKKLVVSPNLKVIPNDAFWGCSKLKSVEVREGTEVISASAFSSCNSLTSVQLPETIREVQSSAFATCAKLKEIHLPDSIEHMEGAVFYGNKTQRFNVPAGLVRYECSAYNPFNPEATQGRSLTFVGEGAFAEYAMQHRKDLLDTHQTADGLIEYRLLEDGTAEITCLFQQDDFDIPETVDGYTVTSIGQNVFFEHGKSLRLPGTINHIGPDNGLNMERINSDERGTVVLNGNITTIDDDSFRNLWSCRHLIIEEGVRSIGKGCFLLCEYVTIELPGSLESIGEGSFLPPVNHSGTAFFPKELVTVIAPPGSCAARYCIENGLRCISSADGTVLNEVPIAPYYTWSD